MVYRKIHRLLINNYSLNYLQMKHEKKKKKKRRGRGDSLRSPPSLYFGLMVKFYFTFFYIGTSVFGVPPLENW